MFDHPTRHSDPPSPDGREPSGEGYEPRPRWVTVLAVVAVAVALLVAVVLVFGGNHGPGRHMGGGPTAGVLAGRAS